MSGDSDRLASPMDVQHLVGELVGVGNLEWKKYSMGHLTFLWGKDMGYMNDVLNTLQRNNNKL